MQNYSSSKNIYLSKQFQKRQSNNLSRVWLNKNNSPVYNSQHLQRSSGSLEHKISSFQQPIKTERFNIYNQPYHLLYNQSTRSLRQSNVSCYSFSKPNTIIINRNNSHIKINRNDSYSSCSSRASLAHDYRYISDCQELNNHQNTYHQNNIIPTRNNNSRQSNTLYHSIYSPDININLQSKQKLSIQQIPSKINISFGGLNQNNKTPIQYHNIPNILKLPIMKPCIRIDSPKVTQISFSYKSPQKELPPTPIYMNNKKQQITNPIHKINKSKRIKQAKTFFNDQSINEYFPQNKMKKKKMEKHNSSNNNNQILFNDSFIDKINNQEKQEKNINSQKQNILFQDKTKKQIFSTKYPARRYRITAEGQMIQITDQTHKDNIFVQETNSKDKLEQLELQKSKNDSSLTTTAKDVNEQQIVKAIQDQLGLNFNFIRK